MKQHPAKIKSIEEISLFSYDNAYTLRIVAKPIEGDTENYWGIRVNLICQTEDEVRKHINDWFDRIEK